MKTLELYEEPLDLLDRIRDNVSEMTEHESAFLCGVIKKYKPKKILEVGVAAGGSTICIMNCLQKLGLDSKVVSCDLYEKYYRDEKKGTGYLLEEVKDFLHNVHNHRFFLGGCLPDFIDEIGGDIDMVLLDTVHSLPGEMLDFLVCLPYLSCNAVVVLHDLCLNFCGNSNCYATKLLFDTVVSDKKYKNEDVSRIEQEGYSNIGMFEVTEDTHKYIENVFSALTISWRYYPEKEMLDKYKRFYELHYNEDLLRVFVQSCKLQKKLVDRTSNFNIEKIILELNELISGAKIYLYGVGKTGKRLLTYLKYRGYEIEGFITTQKNVNQYLEHQVYDLKEYKQISSENDFIILAMNEKFMYEVWRELEKENISTNVYPPLKSHSAVEKYVRLKEFVGVFDGIVENYNK